MTDISNIDGEELELDISDEEESITRLSMADHFAREKFEPEPAYPQLGDIVSGMAQFDPHDIDEVKKLNGDYNDNGERVSGTTYLIDVNDVLFEIQVKDEYTNKVEEILGVGANDFS